MAAGLPKGPWPGPTPEASNGMWPSGRQHASLEAWPRDSAGRLAPCWRTQVVEDTQVGWPGQCAGLPHTQAQSERECGTTCLNDAGCSVWQYTASGCAAGKAPEFCNSAVDTNTVQVIGAQRVVHGDVRVLKDLRGWQLQNLKFAGALLQGGVEHCRRLCHSELTCEYWLYGKDGCWFDDPATAAVEYPLTTGPHGATTDTNFARTVIAGEYLQHFCPPQPVEPVEPAHASRTGGNVVPDDKQVAVLADPGSVKPAVPFFSMRHAPHFIMAGLVSALLACLCFIAADAGFNSSGAEEEGDAEALADASRGAAAAPLALPPALAPAAMPLAPPALAHAALLPQAHPSYRQVPLAASKSMLRLPAL